MTKSKNKYVNYSYDGFTYDQVCIINNLIKQQDSIATRRIKKWLQQLLFNIIGSKIVDCKSEQTIKTLIELRFELYNKID